MQECCRLFGVSLNGGGSLLESSFLFQPIDGSPSMAGMYSMISQARLRKGSWQGCSPFKTGTTTSDGRVKQEDKPSPNIPKFTIFVGGINHKIWVAYCFRDIILAPDFLTRISI